MTAGKSSAVNGEEHLGPGGSQLLKDISQDNISTQGLVSAYASDRQSGKKIIHEYLIGLEQGEK